MDATDKRICAFFVVLILSIAVAQVKLHSQELVWPVPVSADLVTSRFGTRDSPMGGGITEFHFGTDIKCPIGTQVHCAGNGIIVMAGRGNEVFGNYIVVELYNGYTVLYGHLSDIWYATGARVSQGQVIGLSGNTGISTGPHIHVQLLVNPELVFAKVGTK
jgi:murein DD-endopeptidase MepM/ murein hydrolase activator NlpD